MYPTLADRGVFLRTAIARVGKFIQDLEPSEKENEHLWSAASAFWPKEVKWSDLEGIFQKILAKERATS